MNSSLDLPWGVLFFVLVGSFLLLTAAVGLLRFRDGPARLHPPTKASVLGLSCFLIASMWHHAILNHDWLASIRSREILVLALSIVVAPLSGDVLIQAWVNAQGAKKSRS